MGGRGQYGIDSDKPSYAAGKRNMARKHDLGVVTQEPARNGNHMERRKSRPGRPPRLFFFIFLASRESGDHHPRNPETGGGGSSRAA